MRFVSPCFSVKLSAASALALMAGSTYFAAGFSQDLAPFAVLAQFTGTVGIFGLAIGTFAVGRYWGQLQNESGPIMRQGFSSSPDFDTAYVGQSALIDLDAKGNLLACNQAGQTLIGARSFELESDGLKNRIHVQDRPEFLTRLSQAAHGKYATRTTVRLLIGEQDNQNRHLYTLVSFDFSPHAGNRVVASLAALTATEAGSGHPGDLLADLQNAHASMDAAKRAKTNFLNSISHELRTPLNAIIGFSDLLNANINGELNQAHREYVGHIHQSGTHLLGIVNTLLEMSRIDAGHVQLDLSTIAPDGVIERVVSMLAPIADKRGIELVQDLPPALPHLVADERACTQIMTNLVSNAIKFSAKGAQVTVRVRRERDTLKIDVLDTGIGIDKDALAKLGTPFYQVEEGANRHYEGAGLGLSIVKGLIDLHHGKINFASVPGQGTQVSVSLPLDGPQNETGDQRAAPATTESSQEIAGAAARRADPMNSPLRHARG